MYTPGYILGASLSVSQLLPLHQLTAKGHLVSKGKRTLSIIPVRRKSIQPLYLKTNLSRMT